MSRCWRVGVIAVFAVAASGVSVAENPGQPRAEARTASAANTPAADYSSRRDAPIVAPVPADLNYSASNPAIRDAPSGPTASIPAKAGNLERVRFVYRLGNMPATDAASAINGFLHSESDREGVPVRSPFASLARSVAVVAEPISNSLMVSGTPDAVDEVRKLVTDLDKPPRTVVVEVVIGEAPAFSDAGSLRAIEALPPHMERIARVRLQTLDNQPARVQIGRRILLFGCLDAATAEGRQNQPTMANVGLTLGVTPRVTPDNETIVMDVDFESSQRERDQQRNPNAGATDSTVPPPRIDTIHTHTTVRAANGRAVVLGTVARRAKPDKEVLIVLTPHVLEADKGEKAATKR